MTVLSILTLVLEYYETKTTTPTVAMTLYLFYRLVPR
jgi:hypothetical protein